MDTAYCPQNFEKKIYQAWEASGVFSPDQCTVKNPKPFLITMPPPNVTGVLHQGHALFVSIEDTYTRWKRMQGYKTLWLPGTDHAGIATQLMVERLIHSEGTSRIKIGREEFLRRTWEWKEKHGGIIQQQLRALGASCDWSRERFTMDEQSNRSVRASFIRFYNEGLIYQGERIVNWSTGLQTAVSDLEVESKAVEGFLYHIRYPLADGSGEIIVATTRPETMYADVALAIHPEDDRYQLYHGKNVILPLTSRKIPIIQDTYVDREFGSGALKITPGHDHNDWKLGQQHKLPTLSVIERDGKLNQLAGDCAGLDVKTARIRTVEKLEREGFLVKKEPHAHEVGHCQRSGVVIEPLVSMQWWMKMQPLADKALAAAKNANHPALQFFPDFWTKTYFEWLENIQDWCISRQLWWGHQIPAWHCKDCEKITVPKSEKNSNPSSCEHCHSKNIVQDEDVLDTWYSSGLWPITTLGWPDTTEDLEFFYPKVHFSDSRAGKQIHSLMETGSDIIFFWVARMMMMCTHLMDGKIPFEDVYLHSIVRDSKGQKMSKTKGNVVDPMDIIQEHGADSLRLTLLALSGGGRSINFDLKRLEGYKSFLNKIWNAARFTLSHLSTENATAFHQSWTTADFSLLNSEAKWILHKLNHTSAEVNRHLGQYRFDLAFQTIYQFTWYEFCDWYLEFAKLQDLKKVENQRVLHYCITNILKLLHPLAPHVTEEIYSYLPGIAGEKIINAEYPTFSAQFACTDEVLEEIQSAQEIIEGIRNFRTENQIAPRQEISSVLILSDKNILWSKIAPLIQPLAKIKNVDFVSQAPQDGLFGKVSASGFHFFIPLDDLVDKTAEIVRLQNEISKIQKDLEFVVSRLQNKAFIERAKPELIEKEKDRERMFKETLQSLETSLSKLKSNG